MSQRWLVFAPLIFLILWSTGYSMAKLALQYSEPMTLLALRYACVLAIMVPLFVVIRPELPKTRMDWVHLSIVGLLIQTVYFGFCWLGFRQGVAAGTLALIMSFQPILVALIAPRWSGENVSWLRWAGLVLGLLGTGLVIIARSEMETATLLGYFYTSIGLLGITGASLWEKRFGKNHHPVTANLIGYFAGFLGILPFMFALETMQINWTWEFAGALSYLVIGNSIIAVGILLALIRAGDVSSVSSLMFLVPPLAALIAWAMLREELPFWGWIGMGIAALGVYVATRKTKV